jgi:polar amino acid transport system substrate-binding protein
LLVSGLQDDQPLNAIRHTVLTLKGVFMNSSTFRIMLTLVVALACVAMTLHAYDGKKILVAVNSNWPPMEMKDQKGRIVGYEIDLINAIAAEAGLQVKFADVPWRKIFNELDEGKYDAIIASVSITDGRREKYDFSEPYFTAEQLMVVPKAMAEEPLNGKTIAAFKLTTGAETIRLYQKCSITFYTVEETEKAFRDLSKGYIYGILCDSPLAVNYAVYNKKYKGKFAIRTDVIPEGSPTPRENYGIVVKKGNAELLTLINQGLQTVRDKGIEGKIREKWIQYEGPVVRDLITRPSSTSGNP